MAEVLELHLMGVALLAFSVSLISAYGAGQIALLIYLGHLSAIALLLDALLWYAERQKLTAPALMPELFTQILVKGLRLPVPKPHPLFRYPCSAQ